MTIRPRPSTTSFRHAAILVVTGLAYLLVARAGLLLASDEHGIAVVGRRRHRALAITLSAPVAACAPHGGHRAHRRLRGQPVGRHRPVAGTGVRGRQPG